MAAASLCIFALSFETEDPSAFTCAFIGSIIGEAAAGHIGDKGGELLGNAIYETF
ncbi:hypothetical protein D3C80_2120860 [compost metagenome]